MSQKIIKKLNEIGQAQLEHLVEQDGQIVNIGGLPDAEVAALLNAPDPGIEPAWQDAPCSQVRGVLQGLGVWGAMSLSQDPAIRNAYRALLDQQVLATGTVPQYREAVQASLAALVSASLITQEQAGFLLSFAQRPRSWAEAELGREVSPREIGLARGAQ